MNYQYNMPYIHENCIEIDKVVVDENHGSLMTIKTKARDFLYFYSIDCDGALFAGTTSVCRISGKFLFDLEHNYE
jgi:hypothetical protein